MNLGSSSGDGWKRNKFVGRKEQVAGFPASVNDPAGTDSSHPGSVTCAASIQELLRLLLRSKEEHFVSGEQGDGSNCLRSK